MAKIISDEEMAAMEAQEAPPQKAAPAVLSDEQMLALEQQDRMNNRPSQVIKRGLVNYGAPALRTAGKVLDYPRGAMTAPLLGKGLELLTGKPVYSHEEQVAALNPTTTQTFPSATEMYARAGVPEGAKLSDYLKGYKEKGKGEWYQPEKGGLLDPTLRGAGGTATDMAIDPLTWLSMGGSAAAKKGVQEAIEVGARQTSKAAAEMGAKEAAVRASEKLGPELLTHAPEVGGRVEQEALSGAGKTLLEGPKDPDLIRGLPANREHIVIGEPPPGIKDVNSSSYTRQAPGGSPEVNFPSPPEGASDGSGLLNMGAERLKKLGSQAVQGAQTGAQAVSSPLSTMLEKGGQSFYNKGVLPIIQAGRKKGKTELGEQMLESGVRGTPASIAEQMLEQKRSIGAEMGESLKELQAAGAKGDALEAYKPFIAKARELQAEGRLSRDQVRALTEKFLEPQLEYIAQNGKSVPTDILHKWRQDIDNNLISQAAWGPQGVSTAAGKKTSAVLAKALRGGLNAEVDRSSAEALGKDFSESFRDQNKRFGQIGGANVQNAAQSMANAAEKPGKLSVGDLLAIGAGGAGSSFVHHSAPETMAAAFVAKKAYDAATSTAGRTYIGTGMKKLGQSQAGKVLDAYARRKFINATKENDNGQK